jgi:hypothetical protein
MFRGRHIRPITIAFAFLFAVPPAVGQIAPGSRVRYEVAATWLGFTPGGNVQTNSNRVNFVSDLGIATRQSQVAFRFLARPWNRGGIFFEFIPYRFSGEQAITRSFRFGGVTYPVNESITAKASLNHVAVGYQYDAIESTKVELAVLGAAVYIGVDATATGTSVGENAVQRAIPFPLAGLAVRFAPDLQTSRLSFRGEARGMTFGSYGHYVDGAVAVGLDVSPHVTVEAGYRFVDGEGHHAAKGGALNFRGPAITFRLHDR